MQFDHPFAQYFWLVPILLVGLLIRRNFSKQKALNDLKIAPSLILQQTPFFKRIQEVCLVLSASFAVLAMMGPVTLTFKASSVPVHVPPTLPLLLLVDVSPSMLLKDTISGKSRLEVAKEVVDTVLNLAPGSQVGIFGLSKGLTVLSPLTYDTFYLKVLLKEVGEEVVRTGTNFLPTLKELNERVKGPAALLILSDGGDESFYGQGTPEEVKHGLDTLLEVLQNKGVSISTLGIGSKKGALIPNASLGGEPVISKLEPFLLENLAKAGGGFFKDANQESVNRIAEGFVSWVATERGELSGGNYINKTNELENKVDNYQYVLILCLFFFIINKVINKFVRFKDECRN